MSWRDRARKIDPKSDWRSRARKANVDPELIKSFEKKEQKTQENIETGEAIREDISSRAKEFFTPPPIEDLAISAAQGVTAGHSDELYGAAAAAYKKATGDERPIEEIYKTNRDDLREVIEIARERSPVTSMLAEGVGASANPLMRAGGFLKTMLQGAAIGAGEAQEKEDVLTSTIIGAGMGGLTDVATKVAKLPFEEEDILRGRFLGAKKKDFKIPRGRLGNPEDTAAFLNDMNIFKYRNADFDVDGMVFKPIKGGRGTPERREVLSNIDNAIEKLSARADKILAAGKGKIFIDRKAVATNDTMMDLLAEVEFNQTDVPKASRLIEQELNNLYSKFETFPRMSLSQLNKLKQIYQSEARDIFKKQDVKPSQLLRAKAKKAISTGLKDLIEKRSGSKQLAKINNAQHQMYNAYEGLSDAVANAKVYGNDPLSISPYAGPLFQIFQNIRGLAGGGERGMLMRARGGEIMRGAYDAMVPEMAQPAVETTIKQMPARESVKFLERDEGRSPQSIPEELVRTPLPRSSEEIIANKDFILAKVAQQAPEMFDAIRDTIERDPQAISEVLPALVMAAPHLFERDPYNRIDGKIVDPKMREKATQDTMGDDDLSYLEKTLIINKLNKTGIFDAK